MSSIVGNSDCESLSGHDRIDVSRLIAGPVCKSEKIIPPSSTSKIDFSSKSIRNFSTYSPLFM